MNVFGEDELGCRNRGFMGIEVAVSRAKLLFLLRDEVKH